MSGPLAPPWTEIGRLQSDIHSIEQKLHGKVSTYELSSLHSKVDGLERAIGEIRSSLDGLRFELQALQEGRGQSE